MFGTVAASVLARVGSGAGSSVASSGLLAADDGRLATLGRLFLIAVLVLIPYGIWLYRRDRRGRGPSDPAPRSDASDVEGTGSDQAGPNEAGSNEAGPDDVTTVDPGDLRLHLHRIEEFALRAPDGTTDDQLVVEIIEGCRLDGTPVATAIALALVTDTARQCGLAVSPGVVDDTAERAASPSSQVVVLTRATR